MFASLTQPPLEADFSYDVAYVQTPLGLIPDEDFGWGRKRVICGETWYQRALKRSKLVVIESMLKVRQMIVEFPDLDALSALSLHLGYEPHPALLDLSHNPAATMCFPGARGETVVAPTAETESLKRLLKSLHIDDSLRCGSFRLEYVGSGGAGFDSFRLVSGQHIVGIRDITSRKLMDKIYEGLALYLVFAAGFKASECELVEYGALTVEANKHRRPTLFLIGDEKRKGRKARWETTIDTTPRLIVPSSE